MKNVKIGIASDSSNYNTYTADTDSTDIIDIAYKFGRAESGERVDLLATEGHDFDADAVLSAYWDSQYRKYRRVSD